LFDEQSLVGLDDELRAQFRARAVPTPERVAKDPQQLSDERRYDVPITIITCEFTSDEMRKMIESDHPYTREVAKVRNVGVVDRATGHWPQFSEPVKLADLLVSAVNAAGGPRFTPSRSTDGCRRPWSADSAGGDEPAHR